MSEKFIHSSDPTGAVDLESPNAVLAAVDALLGRHYGAAWRIEYRTLLAEAMADVARAFRGEYEGLLRCDTHYHDLRHALDAALATARLIDGFNRSGETEPLTAEQALLGVLLALAHDIGLLRRRGEESITGASLTPVHERRGGEFMDGYLSRTWLESLAAEAELIMVTRLDYALRPDWLPWQRNLARLLGTADLMSQLADRCYLEKCRDFLFIEFSAIGLTGQGNAYPDRESLLRKTPAFYTGLLRKRVEDVYDRADRYLARHFDGVCPYNAAIERNFTYLETLLSDEDFTRLRRQPQRVIDGR